MYYAVYPAICSDDPTHTGAEHHMSENPWRLWHAWHPVYAQNRGMVWAWPWARQQLLRRYLYTAEEGLLLVNEWGTLPPVAEYRVPEIGEVG